MFQPITFIFGRESATPKYFGIVKHFFERNEMKKGKTDNNSLYYLKVITVGALIYLELELISCIVKRCDFGKNNGVQSNQLKYIRR